MPNEWAVLISNLVLDVGWVSIHITTMSENISADILIAGGGLAGMSLACALGAAKVSTILVEPIDPTFIVSDEYDGRTTAVAASSKRMLDVLGIWKDVENCAQPIWDIRVSDSGSPFFVHYDHNDSGAEALGWIVENKKLRNAMLSRLRKLPSVRLLFKRQLTDFEILHSKASCTLSDDTQIYSRLIVAADGRKSPTRQKAGISVVEWPYDQQAIICTVAHEHKHFGVAHEHFLKSGPFAILPLTGKAASIVWTEKKLLAPHIVKLPDDAFLEELSLRFGEFLGTLALKGPRWCLPLGLMHASTYISERVVLVADAAHTIHPIAGQGINIGWRDIAALAEVVINAMRLGLDPGLKMTLEKYERWRRTDNTIMLATTDGLNRLFSNEILGLVIARNIGLASVQRLPALKKLLMSHAMGDVGDLPKLIIGKPI